MNGPILSIITVNVHNHFHHMNTLSLMQAPLMVVEKLSYNMKKKTLI